MGEIDFLNINESNLLTCVMVIIVHLIIKFTCPLYYYLYFVLSNYEVLEGDPCTYERHL